MFNLHGGGFSLGKRRGPFVLCRMSQRGFWCSHLNIRLHQEALFLQILKDLMTGMEMQRDIFETYDGDGEHIYMTGTSVK